MAYPLMRRVFGKYLLGHISNLEGKENIPQTGATLFVANHVGWHEPILAYTAINIYGGHRKLYTLAKWPIFKVPIFRKWTGGIPVYEDKQKTVDIAKEVLHEGENILIYPEGGTNKSSIISDVKTGVARLALASRCTVIPIGMKRVTPHRDSWLGRLFEIFHEKVEMRFGKPVDLSAWLNKPMSRELLYEATDHIMRQVAQLAQKDYRRN